MSDPESDDDVPHQPPGVQIVFCGPNGERKNGPLIMPAVGPFTKLDPDSWSEEESITNFLTFLEKRDDDGLMAAMNAFDRLQCWRQAFAALMKNEGPNEALGQAVMSFWISYGFHIARSLRHELYLVIDALRHLLPAYEGPSLTLYRSELRARYDQRVYGLSWTQDLKVAATFSRRRASDEGKGVILKITATAAMLIGFAGGHTDWIGEGEYVVDPRSIDEVEIIEDTGE